MLKRKRINGLVGTVLAFMAVMPAAMSQTRTVIPAQNVADAMLAAGIAVASDQIELLSGVSTAKEGASVRVVSVAKRTDGTVKVKLRCDDNHDCLPFYVLVHGVERVNVNRSRTDSVQAVAASSPANIIRGGDRATLILETPDSRMSFPVICLQSGVRGQRVRAASPDRKQFYDAEVVAAGILKGTL